VFVRTVVFVALVACVTATALADPTDRCIAESETGQRLVLTRHFVEARDHLVACGRAECPAAVSRDCIDRLHQAEASMASVVLVAQLADGTAVHDLDAFVDDRPAQLGEALWLDPGAHRVLFEHAGARVAVDATAAEGVRLQRITGTFAIAPRRSRGPIVIGASGVALLAAGSALGLVSRSHHSAELAECASPTTCTDHAAAQRDYDAATRYATASTITFVAGGALVAAATLWWVAARPHDTLVPTADGHEVGLAYLRAF
jgi:hypothetical protein